jgi:hypothetical protein
MLGSPMKTKVTTLIMLAAIATAFSCSKESATTENETVNMTPMTFSVNEEDGETKTALGSGNLSVNWTAGDKIAIFDNVSNTPLSFDVDATHNSASGSVTSSSTTFYALYPYDAAATISGSVITTTIPTTQYAVAGGFAEEANVSVAYTTSTEKSFTFHNVCALVKFTIGVDNVKSVTFSGNANEKIAGTAAITYGTTPSVDMTKGSASVTLKKADGTTLTNGTTYYIAVAPQALTGGVTVKLTLSDGSVRIANSTNPATLTRNKIKNFGSISGTAYTSLYDAYQAGATIDIAGIGYNKVTNGNATLLDSSTQYNIYTYISGKTGVFFLKGATTFEPLSSVNITKDVYLISDNPSSPATITNGSKYFSIRAVNFALKNININITSTYFSASLAGATEDIKSLHIDNCTITTSSSIFTASRTSSSIPTNDLGINSIIICNSTIKVNSSVVLFNANSCNKMEDYKDISIWNNVVYSNDAYNCQVFNYANAISQNGTVWNANMSMRNNIFYNITSTNGLLRHYQVTSLTIGKNIYVTPSTGTVTSKSYYLFSSSQDITKIINTGDIYFNNGSTTNTWIYSGYGQTGVTNTLTSESTSPFTSFDTTTGAYVLNSAYTSYGPQN